MEYTPVDDASMARGFSGQRKAQIVRLPGASTASDMVRARSCWQDVKAHAETIMNIVICLNTLQMGIAGEWKVQEYPSLRPVYTGVDFAFNLIYVVEVFINLAVKECQYFCDPWLVTDLAVTSVGVYSFIEELQSENSANHTALGAIRIARLIRLVRLVRILRVMKSVPELVMVVQGLMRALRSLGWVLLLMVLVQFVFAVFFTNVVDNDIFDRNFFEDSGHAMLTLIDISIMAEWGSIVRPVMEHQPALILPFIIYILITAFGMLNVMIGVIVESTAQAKTDIMLDNRRSAVERAVLVWKKVIHDRNLSAKDIQDCATEEEKQKKTIQRREATHEILHQLLGEEDGIPFPHGLTPEDIYDLLDFDAGGDLSLKEFEEGLERLLFGDSFQLTCLILTLIGKMRRERQKGEETHTADVRKLLQHIGGDALLSEHSSPTGMKHRVDLQALQSSVAELSQRMERLETTVGGIAASTAQQVLEGLAVANASKKAAGFKMGIG